MTEQEKKNKIYGVDDETQNKLDQVNEGFQASDKVNQLDANRNEAKDNYGALVSKKEIISNDVKKDMNKTFKNPSIVTETDAWLSSQLQKIQSGKTSFTDDVKAMMDKITNREKFSYDVDSDPLFQQALASAMNSGKQAMQDTIGQASALTGGYGSTYATTAGNQAYNSFIEDAYDNLPQYYQMAMDAYQMEGDELYRQFGMYSEMDDKEFNRNVAAYDATYAHRNQMYNEAYGQFRDEKSDAFAMANLQLNEHGQRVNDAYNYYNITANEAETQYNREYSKWSDDVKLAYQYAQMLNSDAWNTKNFDEGVRQYEQSFAEQQRQFDKTYAQNEDHFTRNLNFQASENAKNRAASGGGGNPVGGLSTPEFNAAKKAYDDAGGGEAGYKAAVATLNAMGIPVEEGSALEASLLNAFSNSGGVTTNVTGKGKISKFRTDKGDNFDVTIGSETYRVENHGKVEDKDTIDEFNDYKVDNGQVFTYNGDAYAKYAGGYYKIGATSIFGVSTSGNKNLLNALQSK